ncbi:facilitated trehalose transporter Tret1-2 homolog [Euwallacea similis]|uniref:facilitated trehalose transporter Tret1-2 homolog n=1 Tax=Euwallacea similis TaxID=1736056 RepID=UPI00344FD28E
MRSKETCDRNINNSEVKEEVSKLRICLAQIVAVNVKNVLLVVYGLTLGMPTMLIPNLTGSDKDEPIVLDNDGVSWLGSLNFLSVPIGCLISGTMASTLGRIRSMQIICILFFGAFLLYYFASQSWHIFFALFLTGFSGGLLEAPTLIYTVEITDANLRGALCSTSTAAIAIGVMVSFILGTVFPWRIMAIINGSIPITELVLLMFIPESPYWLISRKEFQRARENLAWLRGWCGLANIEEEFQNICNRLDAEQLQASMEKCSLNFLKEYCKPTFIKPYLMICVTFVLANFGTPQINVYAVKLFELLKVSINSYYATILVGVAEILGSILLIILVKPMGKRRLSFTTQLGISIGFLITGIYAYNIGVLNFETTAVGNSDYSWIPLFSIPSIAFFSYLMTFTLPWIIMGEVYPSDIRDNASGISAATGYIIAFISNKCLLSLVEGITLPGVLWLYSVVAFLGIFVLYLILPETEGKSLFEITEHYAGRAKLDNKVGKKASKLTHDIANNVIRERIANKGFDEY